MDDLQSGYERRIGRYGQSLARAFLEVCGLSHGERVLEVGAGGGALTGPLAAVVGADAVVALDPDADALELCRTRVPGVEVVPGSAERLPFGDSEFDAVLAQLVLGLLDDAHQGVSEMRRVARAGGLVATCVWDFGAGMTVLRSFWDAAAAVRPDARAHDQALTRPFSTAPELAELFGAAGLTEVTTGSLEAAADYVGLDDLWQPMLVPDGAPGRFLAGLSEPEREAVRAGLWRRLGSPEGRFRLTARAWYARGRA